MEWEILMTSQVEAFLDDLYENDRESHRLVNQAILVLECNGPAEGRPLVDVVTASRISNMKELRPPSTKRTEIRILFVFDPWRSAVVAGGGRQVRSLEAVVSTGDTRGGTSLRDVRKGAPRGETT
jgi:hypothetical protein